MSQAEFEAILKAKGLRMSADGRHVVRGVSGDSTSGCGPEGRVRLPLAPQAGAMQRARKKPIEIDGHKFPTAAEAKRYEHLRADISLGVVRNLQVHPWWQITVNNIDICRVVADFGYERWQDLLWVKHFEDVKTERVEERVDPLTGNKTIKVKFTTDTRDSKRGRKLVLACYGIEIQVIK